MKKWLTLLLTVILCMSLAACGDSPAPDTESDTSETQSTPLSDSHTGSTTSTSTSTSTSTTTTTSTTKPTTPAYLQRWYDRLKGTWFAVDKEGLVCESFTIDAAQNITINGKSYSMKLTTQESWKWASIDAMNEDGSKAYDLRIDLRDGGWSTMSFIYQNKNGSYYREDQVDTVTLTKDNWKDYFEPGEYVGIGLNAFEEYERMYVQPHYRIKEKYSHLIPEISSGAIEFTVKYTEKEIEMFPAEKRYVWGATVAGVTPYTDKRTERLASITVDEKGGQYISGFGFLYASFGLYNLEETSVGQERYPSLEEVHRLTGALYFYNGTE